MCAPTPAPAQDVFVRMEEKGMRLDVTDRFKDRLVDEGYSPIYGARPLRRAIMRLLEDILSESMLAGDLKEGDSAVMDLDAEGNIVVLNTQGEVIARTVDSSALGIA